MSAVVLTNLIIIIYEYVSLSTIYRKKALHKIGEHNENLCKLAASSHFPKYVGQVYAVVRKTK